MNSMLWQADQHGMMRFMDLLLTTHAIASGDVHRHADGSAGVPARHLSEQHALSKNGCTHLRKQLCLQPKQ